MPSDSEAGARFGNLAALDHDLHHARSVAAARAAGDAHARDGADGRECLAAKTEALDITQNLIPQIRGRKALDGEDAQFLAAHAAAVIGHADKGLAAVAQGDFDARGSCIERVFRQLLHGGGGTFDHLAGGDAVDERGWQAANGHKAV